MNEVQKTAESKKLSRWPGTVLSVFVPGFGLIRAGDIRRGVKWLVGIEFLGIVVGIVFVAESIPMIVGWGAVGIGLLVQIWML